MNNNILAKVYNWFGLGLLLTFLTAFITSTNENLIRLVFSGPTVIIIIILELICAIVLPLRIRKMSKNTAIILYLGYAFLTGLTFSSIFILYELTSIIWIFLVTSIIFFILATLGKNTKVNLKGLGTFLLVLLLSIIILEIINIFIMNNTLNVVTCIMALVIFMGYVFYDINKISNYYEDDDKIAILGAFEIYLDFINIFIRLLQLFGKRRD